MHPFEGIEKGDEGFGTQRECVHLGGDEEHALLLQQHRHHLDDVARGERVEDGLVAELVGEGEAMLRRHDDLDELLENDELGAEGTGREATLIWRAGSSEGQKSIK